MQILKDAESTNLRKRDFYKQRADEIKEILDRFIQEPPKQVWLAGIAPEMTPRVQEAIRRMTWAFLTFEKGAAFLTCDNPVFFFRAMGIGKPESEISFPISSHIMLWLSWRSDFSEAYYPVTERIVKEMNRRTASNASRYVFHSRDDVLLQSELDNSP